MLTVIVLFIFMFVFVYVCVLCLFFFSLYNMLCKISFLMATHN